MRTPKAFRPPGLEKSRFSVLVTPLALNVTGSEVLALGAIHVQNSVLHTDASVLSSTQESVTSRLSVGQHVTVVKDATPVLSWQALT